MPKKQIVGEPFAFAFYSPALHLEQPASTYAFCQLRYSSVTQAWLGDSKTINLLWRDKEMDLAEGMAWVARKYPDATFKGLFTDQNFLVDVHFGAPFDHDNDNYAPGVARLNIKFRTARQVMLSPRGLKVVGPKIDLTHYENGPIKRIDPPDPDGTRNRHLELVRDGAVIVAGAVP